MRRGLVAGTLVAAVLVPASAAASADAARYIPGFTGSKYGLQVKPKRIAFGAANLVTGVRWRSWGGSNTSASGTLTSTSGGADIRAKVAVRAYRVRSCGGKPTYTAFKLTRKSGSAIGALSEPQRLYCPS